MDRPLSLRIMYCLICGFAAFTCSSVSKIFASPLTVQKVLAVSPLYGFLSGRASVFSR